MIARRARTRHVVPRTVAVLLTLGMLLRAISHPGAVGVGGAQGSLADLPLTFPVQSPEVATFFNRVARPTDIASFPSAVLHLLPLVTAGQRMAAFPSWTDAETRLDALTEPLDWVMYNPEHWDNTPAHEQADLLATVRRAHAFAHDRGLRLMLAPDRRFADAALADLAPHTDALLLQGQRLQADPAAFAAWVTAMATVARTANPQVLVFVQVGATVGSAEEMATALEAVAPQLDGLAVWSMPRTLSTLEQFVERVRPPEAVTPSIFPAVGTPPSAPPRVTTRATPSVQPSSMPTAPRGAGETTPSATSLRLTATRGATGPAVAASAVASPSRTAIPPSPTVAPTAASLQAEPAERPSAARPCLAGIGLAAGGLAVGALIACRVCRRSW